MATNNRENPLIQSTVENITPQVSAPAPADLEVKASNTKSGILAVIEEIKSQLQDSQALNEALKVDLESAKEALAQKEQEIAQIVAERDEIKLNMPTMEGLTDEVAFTREELRKAEDNERIMKESLDDRNNTVKELQERIAAVNKDISASAQDLRQEIDNSHSQQNELDALIRERDDIIRERDRTAIKNQTLEAETNRLKEQCTALEEIYSALKGVKS